MRVAVGAWRVAMPVRVARRGAQARMRVVVMAVVVAMGVHVLERLVRTCGCSCCERSSSATERDQEQRAGDLRRRNRLAEHEPRRAPHPRTAPTRRPPARASRRASAPTRCRARCSPRRERADAEPRHDRRRRRPRTAPSKAEHEVRRARDGALPEGARRRCLPVDARGPVVVEPPADAGARPPRARPRDRASRRPRRPAAPAASRPPTPSQPRGPSGSRKNADTQHRGGRHLQVEQQRDRARRRGAQARPAASPARRHRRARSRPQSRSPLRAVHARSPRRRAVRARTGPRCPSAAPR